MDLTSGTYEIGPACGRLLLRTTRAGLGAKAGHDLTIEVTEWSGVLVVDLEDPSVSSVQARIATGSLEVREGTGGLKPLTDANRAEIKQTIADKILHPDLNPWITFTSTEIDGPPEGFTVVGDLDLCGQTRSFSLSGELRPDRTVQARGAVVQSAFGIKPYSAFVGALRLADEVGVTVDFALTPS